MEYKIRERLIPTVDGGSSLRYFDGATMASYMYPAKASETVFCRRVPESSSCQYGQGFDPERTNLPITVLEVKASSLGEHAGRGVFAKQDIPQMSYLGLERLVPRIHFSPKTYDLTRSMQEHYLWRNTALGRYTQGYGHSFSHHVRSIGWQQQICIESFNHVISLKLPFSLGWCGCLRRFNTSLFYQPWM